MNRDGGEKNTGTPNFLTLGKKGLIESFTFSFGTTGKGECRNYARDPKEGNGGKRKKMSGNFELPFRGLLKGELKTPAADVRVIS